VNATLEVNPDVAPLHHEGVSSMKDLWDAHKQD